MEQRRFALKELRLGKNLFYSKSLKLRLSLFRDLGFGKSTMEELIRVEVVQLLESLTKEVGQPVQMNNRFNISIINALWTIITGKRHDLVEFLL